MNDPTVPPTPPDEQPAPRVAALPDHQRANLYGPPCAPTGTPSTGYVAVTVRAYIYTRDRMTCQDCGDGPLPIYGDPESLATSRYATLDHVIARIDGGCHHAHNLRVLCQACNPRRGSAMRVARLRATA